MRKFLIVLTLALFTIPAHATDTQAVVRAELGHVLERKFQGADLKLILKHMALAKIYATAVERDATTPDVGTVGYAVDDGSFKWYSSGGWQAVTLTAGGNATVTGVTYSNGGVDRSSAAALAVGATNATAINIGATATPVAITAAGAMTVPSTATHTGAIFANGGIDRSTAAALAVGATNATSVVVTPPLIHVAPYHTATATYGMAYVTDCGGLVSTATNNHVTTLPLVTAASKGCVFQLLNLAGDSAALATLTPNASDGIKGTCVAVEMDGTANKSILNTKDTQKMGDSIKVMSTGASGAAAWLIVGCQGVWARQA